MKLIINLMIASLMLVIGCDGGQRVHRTKHKTYGHQTKVPMRTYAHTGPTNTGDPGDAWLYYYIIYSSNNSCPCMVYTSPTPVTNFSNVVFERTNTVPEEITNGSVAEQEQVELSTNELPQETQTAIDENFDTNDSHDAGPAEEGFDESSSSDQGSDNGSSDGGSSDGGGGDGGGGDGGGGGGE